MALTPKQEEFLDELEEPVETAAWLQEKLAEGLSYVVIKNGRQMTFRSQETMRDMVEYLCR
jgi:hypothetical protein